MTPEDIDRVLGEFRAWLQDPAASPADSPEIGMDQAPVDLHTLVAQFTALRHEVNLQTRATRSATEQGAETLEQLRQAVERLEETAVPEDALDPVLRGIVDAYDNLALALRQVARQRELLEPALQHAQEVLVLPDEPADLPPGEHPPVPNWLARWFGEKPQRPTRPTAGWPAWRKQVENLLAERQTTLAEAAGRMRVSLESLLTGYRMSLARLDRLLEQHELEPIAAVGETFDPDLMEVVEVVAPSEEYPAGRVVEEVRRGYLRGDIVFRYAQVKVAR